MMHLVGIDNKITEYTEGFIHLTQLTSFPLSAELQQRTVRIYKPAKTANSSGRAGTSFWRVDFDILAGSARWENPLMGWASSGDYMQGTFLKFRTKEDAIHFCEKQNWPYYIQTPHKARIGPKSYAANYNYSPGKLRIHHTK